MSAKNGDHKAMLMHPVKTELVIPEEPAGVPGFRGQGFRGHGFRGQVPGTPYLILQPSHRARFLLGQDSPRFSTRVAGGSGKTAD